MQHPAPHLPRFIQSLGVAKRTRYLGIFWLLKIVTMVQEFIQAPGQTSEYGVKIKTNIFTIILSCSSSEIQYCNQLQPLPVLHRVPFSLTPPKLINNASLTPSHLPRPLQAPPESKTSDNPDFQINYTLRTGRERKEEKEKNRSSNDGTADAAILATMLEPIPNSAKTNGVVQEPQLQDETDGFVEGAPEGKVREVDFGDEDGGEEVRNETGGEKDEKSWWGRFWDDDGDGQKGSDWGNGGDGGVGGDGGSGGE
ncbi:uncharacterized protein PAC_02281 [Phialocephala subalpina]|uniref:Uncharacterized protein n=1 Tax=Phialocephala subalpina TaxID=576137 RepID=A0A1L7WI11_9HELO|nr:uncharacterized protein PAC_02281 [Phialocephala subalpina]